MSHVVARKTFFIDEDSHSIALEDSYDGRGNLWRAHAYPLVQAYDAKVMFQAPFITSDLTNGNVLVEALTNERKAPAYVWAQKAKLADFQVDAIAGVEPLGLPCAAGPSGALAGPMECGFAAKARCAAEPRRTRLQSR